MDQKRFRKQTLIKLFCILALSLIIINWGRNVFIEPVLIPPLPDRSCPIVVDWRGVLSGQSTRQDIVNLLGKPDRRGFRWLPNRKFSPYYSYDVLSGSIAKFAQDRIFFRSDGTVDWVEAIIADRDGGFHSVQETVDQLGSTLDIVYANNNYNPFLRYQYDVLAGPDLIYVWSECGLAMIDLPCCSPIGEKDKLGCPEQSESDETPSSICGLTLRQPNPFPGARVPSIRLDAAVLMRFQFPPTSYEGFVEYYMYKIPYPSDFGMDISR